MCGLWQCPSRSMGNKIQQLQVKSAYSHVILNEAKNLDGLAEILRFAQNDNQRNLVLLKLVYIVIFLRHTIADGAFAKIRYVVEMVEVGSRGTINITGRHA
jgi:hypothetical protein